MPKPDFVLVGAAKSGTTSVYEYLRRHSDVFLPSVKELGYFGGPSHAPVTLEQYLSFFDRARPGQVIGEVSSSYLSTQTAAASMLEVLGPSTTILMILRNPVDMVYALWGQSSRSGVETEPFEEAFFQQDQRLRDPAFLRTCGASIENMAYQRRGRYFHQVKRFTDAFGPAVHVFLFEEFFRDVQESMLELYRAIGVSTDIRPPEYRAYNASGRVRWRWLHQLYFEPSLLSRLAARIVPLPLRRRLMLRLYYLNTKAQSRPALPPDVGRRLYEFFEPDIVDLEGLLGRRLRDTWAPHGY